MNISLLKILYVFVLFTLCQPILAQTYNNELLQDLLNQNPELFDDILEENKKEQIDTDLSSNNQVLTNSVEGPKRDLTSNFRLDDLGSQSIINRYYKTLTGENLNIYGAQEFAQTQDESLLFFNLVGQDYEFGLGDIIQISITGLRASSGAVQIQKDGTIIVDDLNPLHIAGLTAKEVSDLILDQILLDDASAKVFVRLDTARLITVQISGNVNSPKTIAVPPFTPLSRLIAFSGGVSDNGSLRNIYLSQNGETTKSVDFYEFLKNPEPINDPLIRKGARVFVPSKGAMIAASGFIAQPGIYELPNEISQINVENFLELTGTNFIPPGAILKVLNFDGDGKSVSRKVSKKDILYQGEALKIEFIETRELNTSEIHGAVLKDYRLSSNDPLSIKEVLKAGSVLSQEAFLPFALIYGKENQVINLNEALIDESILLPIGANLKVFSRKEYSSLVSEDPNLTENPFVSKLFKAKIAEIYLNGERIAYIPLNSKRKFLESISDFYTPSPKTVYDLSLIENNFLVEAFDLRSAITMNNRGPLSNGDRVFIFENKFYEDLLKSPLTNIITPAQKNDVYLDLLKSNNVNNSDQNIILNETPNEKNNNDKYLEALNYSRKILQQSNLINVNLDGELFSYLPYTNGLNSIDILKVLRGRMPKLISEFAIVHEAQGNNIPKIKNLNDSFEITKGSEISFISSETYQYIIDNYEKTTKNNLLVDARSSDAVKVFLDGELVLLLPPNYSPSQLKLFEQYYKKNDLYKLYVGLNAINLETETWDLMTFGAETFFSENSKLTLGSSNIINLFSNAFIKNEFIENKNDVIGVNFNIKQMPQYNMEDAKKTLYDMENAELAQNNLIDQVRGLDLEAGVNDNTISDMNAANSKKRFFDYHIETMRNSLRTISGSVQFPGSYPVANKIRLSNFISTAGLIKSTAISHIHITKAVNQEGRLISDNIEIVSLDSPILNNTILSGLYHLDIPLAYNDAITGVIKVEGEVLHPGNYSFTRSETIQNIIKRAGGLTDVAFPLGAVLQRESTKNLERETNKILADQLDASILNLAQSSLEGAGDQVKVVLGYANQLRIQPTTGRMALNILEDNISSPQFLEDGDILKIPKRPAHITIVGSVQRSTIASYIPGQNFADYLQMAGGLTKVADSRKAYLLLPNGQSRKLNKSTVIPVGSVIIVPPKLDRLSILGGTDIISKVLSNISNSILSIQNVD